MSLLQFFLTFLSAIPFMMAQGRTITCSCTTTHCQEEGVRTCNTTGLCFSQYLDRRDGSDPVVRGCIASRTPLLCENRRPAVSKHRTWPVLMCCEKNMCNAKATPTAPPNTTVAQVTETTTELESTAGPPLVHPPFRYFDSTYVVVIGIGVCCLGVVVAVAVLLSRRNAIIYDAEFGTVAANGYVKGCPEQPPSSTRGLGNKIVLDT